ncbi:MAG: hypothetical protein GXO22_06175 [Aquificae bacterium]|nr:hypothetical protein [Aquificota bacterium]
MSFTLRDAYPMIVSLYKKGDVLVVKILKFYEKTKFLLNKKCKNTSPKKARPIVIIESHNEQVTFFALSKNFDYEDIRPRFYISRCRISKKAQECFNLDLKRTQYSLVFAKKTKTKKLRYTFTINIHLLKELEDEGLVKYCGNCDEKFIEQEKINIDKYFEDLYGR